MAVDASELGIQDLILGLQHVGYISEDTAATVEQYRKLYALTDDQIRIEPPLGEAADTRFTFVEFAGAQFEIIEPISDASKQMLGGERPGINHVAWKVSDVDAAVARMERGLN